MMSFMPICGSTEECGKREKNWDPFLSKVFIGSSYFYLSKLKRKKWRKNPPIIAE